MSLLWLLLSCPSDELKDTAEECPDITAEEAEDARRLLSCEQAARCEEPGSGTVEECMQRWYAGGYRIGYLCEYESFDPCGAAECIIDLSTNRRACGEEFPGLEECHGMFTGYECYDI